MLGFYFTRRFFVQFHAFVQHIHFFRDFAGFDILVFLLRKSRKLAKFQRNRKEKSSKFQRKTRKMANKLPSPPDPCWISGLFPAFSPRLTVFWSRLPGFYSIPSDIREYRFLLIPKGFSPVHICGYGSIGGCEKPMERDFLTRNLLGIHGFYPLSMKLFNRLESFSRFFE